MQRKKNKLWISVIIVGLVAAISIFCGVKKQENDIEHIVKTVIRIQYGWGNVDDLNQICTEEFLENADLDEIYLGRKLYTIEKGYMDNIQEVSGNELAVTVSVYSPDILFHHFTLIQNEDGKYLISNIEHDK